MNLGTPVFCLSYTFFFLSFQGGRKSSFFKQARSYPMFPCHEEKVKWDDYGEFIKYENKLYNKFSRNFMFYFVTFRVSFLDRIFTISQC